MGGKRRHLRRDHSSAGWGLVGDVDRVVGHVLVTVGVVIGEGLFTEPGVLSAVVAVDPGVVSVEVEEQEEAKVFSGNKFKESSLGVNSRAVGYDDTRGDGFWGAGARPEGSGVVAGGGRPEGLGHVFCWRITRVFKLFRGVWRWYALIKSGACI